MLFFPPSIPLVIGLIGAKLGLEGMMMIPRVMKIKRHKLAGLFPLLGLLYSPYSVYVGLNGVLGNFKWKSGTDKVLSSSKYFSESSRIEVKN